MKTMLIIFLSCIIMNCDGQKPIWKSDTLITKSKEMYYIPNVNSNLETFDFQKTKEETLKIPSKAAGLQNPDSKISSYSYTGKLDDNRTIYRSYYEIRDKKNIKEFGESYPLEIIYYNNSPFIIQKTFFPNGNIKEKGLKIVKGNLYKGTWFYFDEKGKLINTIDNDKLFGFSWEQIEKFMEENKIEMLLGNGNHGHSSINRVSTLLYPKSSEKEAPQSILKAWGITWKGEEWNQYYSVVLDGDTGKILKRTKYWVSEEGEDVPEPIIEDFSK